MPRNKYGQLLTFGIEIDADQTFSQYIFLRTSKGDTAAKIAARRGHPELALTIIVLNGLRGIYTPIKPGTRLRLPGTMVQGAYFSVLPANMSRPLIVDGYALHQVNPRPGSTGISQFIGYNPLCMQLKVQFVTSPGYSSDNLERDILILERMAGRTGFKGAAAGAPPVIRVGCDDGNGNTVPLIPVELQWSSQNPSAPLWRVGTTTGGTGNGIVWDDAVTRSDAQGRRIYTTCTIMLIQYTPISVAERSGTIRSKQRNTQMAVLTFPEWKR